MWKIFLRNYFTFTRKERNGLLVLLFIMTLVVIWPTIYRAIYKDSVTKLTIAHLPADTLLQLTEHLPAWQPHRDADPSDTESAGYTSGDADAGSGEVKLFPFDPNALDADEWRQLGVSEKNISTILKYRSKGGVFYKKEDLKKIYGFREVEYQRLEPYIMLAGKEKTIVHEERPVVSVKSTAHGTALVELNTADSLALLSLDGIGPVLSSRIIKYRNKLGGFVSLSQLLEVYGLQADAFESLHSQLTLDVSRVSKININTISLTELRVHPYFRNTLASMIIRYRDQHGNFKDAEALKQVELVNDSVFQKMEPYLEF